MSSSPEIFQFSDFVDYLSSLYAAKKEKNSRYSMRAWSSSLGYQNPSFLSQVLKRERQANLNLIERIREREDLGEREWRHLKILYLKNFQDGDAKEIFSDLLAMNQPLQSETLNVDYFEIVSEWYYLVIAEMTDLKGFVSDADFFVRRIRGGLNQENIRRAIRRLKKVGILEEAAGLLRKVNQKSTVILPKLPNEAVRLYHRSVLRMAEASLDEQNMKQRDFRSSVIALNVDQIAKAKAILDRAHKDIQKLSKDQADCVYQLSTQLFQMTMSQPSPMEESLSSEEELSKGQSGLE